MSYLDPQSWTDVDAGGNPLSWITRQSKLLFPGYEMLRKALVERCTASSTAVPAVLNTARAPGRIYTGAWFTNFHNTISTLIPKFVNVDDNGGNWHGVGAGNFAPVWTEASILLAIGDVARISAPDIPMADWSLQQYKILNKLIWIKRDSGLGWQDGQIKDAGGGGGFAAVCALFQAAPWGDFIADSLGYSTYVGVPGTYILSRRRSKSVIGPYSLPMKVDWYLYIDPTAVGITVFDDEGMGFSNNSFWLFQADAPYAAGVSAVSDYPTDREDCPPVPPAGPGVQIRGWDARTADRGAVIKFDVTGGFKFV